MLDCYGVQPGTVERRCSRVHRAMDLLSDYQHFNAVMLRRRLNREFPAGLQEGAVNYLQKLSLHGRRENTLRSHRNVLLRFTDYLFSVGVTDYKLLSADIVNRYVKVVSCNYSNSVVRLHYSILLRFFQYLAHSGYKETDLSLKMMPIVKVSTSARIPTTLDLSQIESILASVDRESPQGKRDYAVLMIAVKLGIRTSDIRNGRFLRIPMNLSLTSRPLTLCRKSVGMSDATRTAGAEAAPLTGLLYCADCGGKMYVHRTNNGKRISQYTCSQYSKVPVGKLCTTQHRINEDVVLSLVSEMLKAIAEYAKHDRAEFVRVVQEAQSSQQTAEVRKQRTRLATAKQRVSELEVLLCKIYEGQHFRQAVRQQIRHSGRSIRKGTVRAYR